MNLLKTVAGWVLLGIIAVRLLTPFLPTILPASFIPPGYFMPILTTLGALWFILWLLDYNLDRLGQVFDNYVAWGVGKGLIVVGFCVMCYFLFLAVEKQEWVVFFFGDIQPRGQLALTVLIVSLLLLAAVPMINYVVPSQGVFAKSVRRFTLTLLAFAGVSYLLMPYKFFKDDGSPAVYVDPLTNEVYLAPGSSPRTGNKLVPVCSGTIGTEQCKKQVEALEKKIGPSSIVVSLSKMFDGAMSSMTPQGDSSPTTKAGATSASSAPVNTPSAPAPSTASLPPLICYATAQDPHNCNQFWVENIRSGRKLRIEFRGTRWRGCTGDIIIPHCPSGKTISGGPEVKHSAIAPGFAPFRQIRSGDVQYFYAPSHMLENFPNARRPVLPLNEFSRRVRPGDAFELVGLGDYVAATIECK